MTTLKLEVGKIYVNRRGVHVKIVSLNDSHTYPYRGEAANGSLLGYNESGYYFHSGLEDPEDLIALAGQTSLQVGVTYRTNDGGGVRISGKQIFSPDGKEKFVGERIIPGAKETTGFINYWDDDGTFSGDCLSFRFSIDLTNQHDLQAQPLPQKTIYRKKNASYPYGGWVQDTVNA